MKKVEPKLVLISRVGFEKPKRFEKSARKQTLSIKRIRKEKKNQKKKIFTFAVSNNLKFELLFRRSYVFYNIVLYEKIEHDKFMGGSFFSSSS